MITYICIFRWEERWEHLQLILEVYQFARDAAVAEAWLIAQDPYLKSDEFGQSIDEVECLIKKHEAFEKAAAAQEERFAALERLTTVRPLSQPPDGPYNSISSVRVEGHEEATRGGTEAAR